MPAQIQWHRVTFQPDIIPYRLDNKKLDNLTWSKSLLIFSYTVNQASKVESNLSSRLPLHKRFTIYPITVEIIFTEKTSPCTQRSIIPYLYKPSPSAFPQPHPDWHWLYPLQMFLTKQPIYSNSPILENKITEPTFITLDN